MPGLEKRPSAPLSERIEAIEDAYEFMLAYAAQGVAEEVARGSDDIRRFLARLAAAMVGLGDAIRGRAAGAPDGLAAAADDFARLVERDAERALTAVRLVQACPSIGSQVIDNLNASLHLRTLLTDLFLIDEAIAGG